MSALVGYGSSDEEEPLGAGDPALEASGHDVNTSSLPQSPKTYSPSNADPPSNEWSASEGHAPNGSLARPLGPSVSMAFAHDMGATPQSPYSIYRTSVRDLTLPQIPNMEIPPSPPGSPPASIEKKFEHFLELKRQGVHFNEKLSKSAALKNPSLLPKLMASAGLDGHAQYSTTLPGNIWDSTAFPDCAFKEGLTKSQQELSKRKEEKARIQRESVDFVLATNSGQSSSGGAPKSAGAKGFRNSAAERVMAGLDRERTGSPQTMSMRNGVDRRGGQNEDGQHGTSIRSPKRRKRSMSR